MLNLVIFLSLLNPAFGQDTVDAHGFNLAPSDGELHDGLSVWRGERQEKGSFAVEGLFEYADRPLDLYTRVDGVTRNRAVIQDLSALNLGMHYAPVERVALTVAAPLYLNVNGQGGNSGAGLGDVRLAAPVSLLLPDRERVGFGLSVVPFLDAPGFYDESLLKQEKVSGGGIVAASVGDEDWSLSANVGAHFEPNVDLYNLRDTDHLITGLTASYAFNDELALRAEGVFRPTLGDVDPNWSDSPAELLVSARGYTGENVAWTLGGATALSDGVGAAVWRAFAGVNFAFGAKHLHPEPFSCEECPTDLMIQVTDDSGKELDVPLYILDSESVMETTSGELKGHYVSLPSNRYLIHVVVPSDLVVVRGDKILLMEPIYFDFDRDGIRVPDSQDVLMALVETLNNHPELSLIEVAGHTDERGSDDYNKDLSQRRMNSVVDFLVEQGVERDRLDPVGYGESRLLENNCGLDEECHQLNRRVEFTILERAGD